MRAQTWLTFLRAHRAAFLCAAVLMIALTFFVMRTMHTTHASARNTLRNALVLALSTECQYCNRSAPFYRGLIKAAHDKKFPVLAAFTKGEERAEEYLADHGINVDKVIYTEGLDKVIVGTPTILLIDSSGGVKNRWLGLLAPDTMRAVARSAGIEDAFLKVVQDSPDIGESGSFAGVPLVTAKYIKDHSPTSLPLTVLDTRDSSLFRKGHLKGAVNIPVQELRTRAPVELANAENIVVFCQYSSNCQKWGPDGSFPTECKTAIQILQKLKAKNIVLFSEGLASSAIAGIQLESSR